MLNDIATLDGKRVGVIALPHRYSNESQRYLLQISTPSMSLTGTEMNGTQLAELVAMIQHERASEG